MNVVKSLFDAYYYVYRSYEYYKKNALLKIG